MLLAISFFVLNDASGIPKIILLIMVLLWAIRLGTYLFFRIKRIGVDHRFDKMRPVWKRYIRFWILQGASIWIVALPYIIGLTQSAYAPALNTIQTIGMVIWIIGFNLESIADLQKYKFRNDPNNNGQFMDQGLFSVVQFPNYLGEMMCWIGIFIFVTPYLQGLQWLSIISPIWIMTLLLFISGIPYLVRQSKERYGHMESFQKYSTNTKKLIPFIY